MPVSRCWIAAILISLTHLQVTTRANDWAGVSADVRLVKAEVTAAEQPEPDRSEHRPMRSVVISRVSADDSAEAVVAQEAEKSGPAILFADQQGQRKQPAIAVLDPEFQPIGKLVPDIRPPAGPLPSSHAEEVLSLSREAEGHLPVERVWGETVFLWEASALCHNPLYFEDINLERHGHSYGVLQPAVSAARFYGTIPLLPVKMLLDPPCECTYTLGHFRPGSCAPRYSYSLLRP